MSLLTLALGLACFREFLWGGPRYIAALLWSFWPGLVLASPRIGNDVLFHAMHILVLWGCIRYTNSKNEKCHRYFLNCLSIGLVASVIKKRRWASGSFGWRKLTFIPSSLLMIFQRLEYKMKLRIDTDVIDRKVMTVCIGNAQGYGFTPSAVPYNGLLDVSVIYHPEMTQLIEGFYLLYSGKILNHRSVHPYRTREILVDKAERALVGIDGRVMNTPVGPFKVMVEQEVINFIIP